MSEKHVFEMTPKRGSVMLRLLTVPRVESAHSIRWLRVCSSCKGAGSLTHEEHDDERARRGDVLFHHVHAACYLRAFGQEVFLALPKEERGKLTVDELTSKLAGRTKKMREAFWARLKEGA